VLGAAIGGFIGYGLLNAGPIPGPSLGEPYGAAWVFGLGGICGILGAISPDGFWRRRGEWTLERDRDN
jgi:hypothetical protein